MPGTISHAVMAARVAEVLGLRTRCKFCASHFYKNHGAKHAFILVSWTCRDANEGAEAVRAMDPFQRHTYVTKILRGTGLHSMATVINPMLADPAEHLAALYAAVGSETS